MLQLKTGHIHEVSSVRLHALGTDNHFCLYNYTLMFTQWWNCLITHFSTRLLLFHDSWVYVCWLLVSVVLEIQGRSWKAAPMRATVEMLTTYNAFQEYLQISAVILLNNGDKFLEMCCLAVLMLHEHHSALMQT